MTLPALTDALRSFFARDPRHRARTTGDRSIAHRLKAGVDGAEIAAAGLAFYVHDGAVSIYGTVQDPAARDALLAVAARQPGVRRIVDHLRFAEAPAAA